MNFDLYLPCILPQNEVAANPTLQASVPVSAFQPSPEITTLVSYYLLSSLSPIDENEKKKTASNYSGLNGPSPPPPSPSITSLLSLGLAKHSPPSTAATIPPPPVNKMKMTISGPPSSNESNDILNDERGLIWMVDNMSQSERIERSNQIKTIRSENLSNMTESEKTKLEFLKKKVADGAGGNWDAFYKRNGSRFFKDRHYLHDAFPELKLPVDEGECKDEFDEKEDLSKTSTPFTPSPDYPIPKNYVLLEVGCGVGNSLLPLLDYNPNLILLGGDFAESAIDIMRLDERFVNAKEDSSVDAPERFGDGKMKGRAYGEVWDITGGNIFPGSFQTSNSSSSPTFESIVRNKTNPQGIADGVLLLYCLSALPSIKQMISSVKLLVEHMVDGGVLVFRDYGRYDDGEIGMCERNGGEGRAFIEGDDVIDDGEDNESNDGGGEEVKEFNDKTSHFYLKSDSTLIYYFSLSDMTRIFEKENGLVCERKDYIMRQYANRGDGKVRRRVWVEARYRKVGGVAKEEEDEELKKAEKAKSLSDAVEFDKMKQDNLEAVRLAEEKLKLRLEEEEKTAAKLEAEKAATAKLVEEEKAAAAAKATAEKAVAEKAVAEKAAAEKAAAVERAAAVEKAAAAADKAVADKAVADKTVADKAVAAAKAAAEKAVAAKAASDKAVVDKAVVDKAVVDKAAAEKAAAAAKAAADKVDLAKIEADKAAAAKIEVEKKVAEGLRTDGIIASAVESTKFTPKPVVEEKPKGGCSIS